MTIERPANIYICARCLWRQIRPLPPRFQHGRSAKFSTQAAALPHHDKKSTAKEGQESDRSKDAKDQTQNSGGMSRRLARMTEESIEQGGRSIRKSITEGGFSEELKTQLEARIQNSSFKSNNPAAFAQINMPVCPKALPDHGHTKLTLT